MLPISPEVIALVKRCEGFRSAPYVCPAGYPTIGYGHVIADMSRPPVSEAEAEAMLMADLNAAGRQVATLCPGLAVDDHPQRFSVICSFTFNLGAGRLRASTLRRRIAERDWPAAADELRKWVYGGGRKLPGLILRREAEAVLFLK